MNIDDVKVILCDIDDTVTTFNDGYDSHDYIADIFTVFAAALAEKEDVSLTEAQKRIRTYADDLIWWDYPDFIADFDLPGTLVWNNIRQIHQEHISVFDDAVEMIEGLYEKEKNMCVISNNPVTGCLLKLEIAGLADLSGSKYFSRIFGTNVTRGMKGQQPMWKRVVASLGVSPSEILTIGDSVNEDFKTARLAGIKHTVIIDRTSKIEIEDKNGYLAVNNLKNLSRI